MMKSACEHRVEHLSSSPRCHRVLGRKSSSSPRHFLSWCLFLLVMLPSTLFWPSFETLLPTIARGAQQELCATVGAAPLLSSYLVANDAALVGTECVYTSIAVGLGTAVGQTGEANVNIVGGKVLQGNQNWILFKGFPVATAADADLGDRGLLRIAVRNVTFSAGAILKFDRLFPNRTEIVVEGNTFANMLGLANLGSVVLAGAQAVVCILVDFSAVGSSFIVYRTHFTIVIANNTAAVAVSSSSQVCVVCVVFQSSTMARGLTLAGPSTSVSINGNTMVNSTSKSSAFVALLRLSSSSSLSSLTVKDGASIIMGENAMVNCSVKAMSFVVSVEVYSSSSSSTSSLSSLAMEANASVILSGNSIANSIFTSTAYVVNMRVESSFSSSSLSLRGGASLIASRNTIADNSSITTSAYVVHISAYSAASCSVAIDGRASSIILSGNRIANSSVRLTAYVSYVRAYSYGSTSLLSVTDGASLIANGNSIDNHSNIASSAYVIHLYVDSYESSSSFIIHGSASSITATENTLGRSRIVPSAYVLYVLVDAATSSSFLLSQNASLSVQSNSIVKSPFAANSFSLFCLTMDTSGVASMPRSAQVLSQSSARVIGNTIVSAEGPSFPLDPSAAYLGTIGVFEAMGAFQLTVSGAGALVVMNNTIDGSEWAISAAAEDTRIARLELDTAASRPSRIIGLSSLPFPSQLIVVGNSITRVTAQCIRSAVTDASSLGILWVSSGEIRCEGSDARLAVVDNTMRDVLFTPNRSASPSSICKVAFAMVHFSANVGILDGAVLTLAGNLINAVYAADLRDNATRQQLLLDTWSPVGCLLTVNGTVGIRGSELLIISNRITDVNASRSIIAFASNVSLAQMRGGVTIRDNDASVVAIRPSSRTFLFPPPSFVFIRSVAFEVSAGALHQLSIVGNNVEMMVNNRTQDANNVPIPLLINAARCNRSLGIAAECAINITGNVIRQAPSIVHNSTSVITMSSILNLTTIVFRNNTIYAANVSTAITIDERASSVDALFIEGNAITYAFPLLTPAGGGVRSLLRISKDLSLAFGRRGVRILDNVIAIAPSSVTLPPSFYLFRSSWVLFDNIGAAYKLGSGNAPEVVLCPNVVFGADQAHKVVSKEVLLRNPKGFNGVGAALHFECFTRSTTLPAAESPSLSPTDISKFSLTARAPTIVSATLSFVESSTVSLALSAKSATVFAIEPPPALSVSKTSKALLTTRTPTIASATPLFAVSPTASPLDLGERSSTARLSPTISPLNMLSTSTAAITITITVSSSSTTTSFTRSATADAKHSAGHESQHVPPSPTASETRRLAVPVLAPFVPSPVLRELTKSVGVVVVAVGGVALPTAGMVQGVSMALLRMTQCGGEAEEEAVPLPFMVHPLQFGIGDDANKYLRGTVVGNVIIIPFACALIFYFAIPWLVFVVTKRSEISSVRPRTGWPANMTVPLSILAEGSAMASASLLSGEGASGLDVLIGMLGAMAMVATAGIWGFKLHFPFFGSVGGANKTLRCVKAEPRTTVMMWLFSPWSEWEVQAADGDAAMSLLALDENAVCPTPIKQTPSANLSAPHQPSSSSQPRSDCPHNDLLPPVSESDQHTVQTDGEETPLMNRWTFLIGDSWWLWSNLLAFVFSLLVGVAEGMPSNTDTLCRVRWSIAIISAVGQAVAVLTNTVPAELVFIGLSSVVSCVLVVLMSLSNFQVLEGDKGNEEEQANKETLNEVLELVGTISTITGMLIMGVGIAGSLTKLYNKWITRKKASVEENAPLSHVFVELDAFPSVVLCPSLTLEGASGGGGGGSSLPVTKVREKVPRVSPATAKPEPLKRKTNRRLSEITL